MCSTQRDFLCILETLESSLSVMLSFVDSLSLCVHFHCAHNCVTESTKLIQVAQLSERDRVTAAWVSFSQNITGLEVTIHN